jgi:hypothetical protein
MLPQRVPMTRPSRGVKPIEVSTDRPPATAVMLAPLPRWQVMSLSFSIGRPISLGGPMGDIAVGRAVEAVPADAQLPVEGVGQPVDEGPRRDGLMEGRVEDRDLRGPRQERLAGVDALEVVGVVQRRELDAFADGRLDLFGDHHGFGEILAAVDDAVPEAVDLALVADDAVLGMEEQGQDDLDGHAVVEDLADLADPVPPGRLVGDDGVARADLLDDALGQEAFVVHADELELDR